MGKINFKTLLIFVAIPLLVGGISALITMDSMQYFELLEKPPLSPPGWLFPVVWTILYVLMGIALYLVVTTKTRENKTPAYISFAVQLFFNFFWSIIFFNAQAYLFAFIWLLLLWVAVVVNIYFFSKFNNISAKLLIPYLLWVTFAGYLNLGIYILNR